VASFRSGVAALVLLLLLPAARRGWGGRVLLVAVAYAATLILFVLANKATTAASAIFLQAGAPLYLAILSPLLLGEHVRRDEWWIMGLIAVGLVICFRAESTAVATAPDPLLGNLLAIASGICFAFMVLGLRWLGRHEGDHGVAAVAMGNVLACFVALPMALPVPHVSVQDAAVVGYLGVFQIALAYFLVTAALKVVPALEASLLLLLEPVLNPVWAWLVHGEQPGHAALLGGVIILTGTVVLAVRGARRVPVLSTDA
jgi:drug/metabolite transporter (DMT)-like permease